MASRPTPPTSGRYWLERQSLHLVQIRNPGNTLGPGSRRLPRLARNDKHFLELGRGLIDGPLLIRQVIRSEHLL
jgi:hypothetical protein